MAKTRDDIKNQIYAYLPKINQTGKATLINNVIDLAVEEISRQHDFRALRAHNPDTATLTASAYYLDLDSATFSTMCSSSIYLKDILHMRWLKSGTDDYGKITFLDDAEFHDRYGYYDYASRSTGYPFHYTRLADRLIFNCPAYEALTIRCFYQKLHPPFSGDSTEHSFGTKINMAAFMAIVYRSLLELKSSLSSLEFPQELSGASDMYQKYLGDMIAADKDVANEEFELGTMETNTSRWETNPYDWVT
jgi:hypothetical protein